MKTIITCLLVGACLLAQSAVQAADEPEDTLFEHLFEVLRDRTQAAPGSERMAGQPIPTGSEARTMRELRAAYRKWWEQKIGSLYHKTGDEKVDAPALEFVEQCMDRITNQPGAPTSAMLAESFEQFADAGPKDPIVLLLAGIIAPSSGNAAPLLENALAGLQKSGAPKTALFIAASNLGMRYHRLHKAKEKQEVADKVTLTLLGEALPEFTEREQMPMLVELLREDSGQDIFTRKASSACKVLREAVNVEPWVVDYFEGVHFINQAWQARGSGWASTVGEQDWSRFYELLKAAREHLVRSWEQSPDLPWAADWMITVTMAEGDSHGETMRTWFDRAVKARMDYLSAYSSMRWGLRPRWGGSYEAMLAFGEECLKTQRFDTNVPLQYFDAVSDVSLDREDDGEIYRDAAIQKNLRQMLDGYLAAASRPHPKEYYHTLAALIAARAEDYAMARRELEAIDFQPYARASWSRLTSNLQGLVQFIAVSTSPAKEMFLEAEAAYSGLRDYDRALSLYRSATAKAQNDRVVLTMIKNREQTISVEQQLERGEWVSFMPPSEDLSGWTTVSGRKPKLLPDGSLEFQVGNRGYLLACLSRVGPDFEMTGEVEYVSSVDNAYQAGVIFGALGKDAGGAWLSFRLKRDKQGAEKAGFAVRFSKANIEPPITTPLAGNRRNFHLVSWHGGLRAAIDGAQLIPFFKPPRAAPEADAKVGFGAFKNRTEYVVRYRNVWLRRLQSAPEDWQQQQAPTQKP